MNAVSTVAISRLPMFVSCVRCTTPVGSGESIWKNKKNVEDCVCQSDSGSTSTWGTSRSAGSGQATVVGRGMGNLYSIPQMSLRSVLSWHIGWPGRCSGDYLSKILLAIMWGLGVGVGEIAFGVIIHPAVVPYTSMMVQPPVMHRILWRWGLVTFFVLAVTGLWEKLLAWLNSPTRQCEKFVSVMPKVGSVNSNWPTNMASIRPKSAMWSIGRPGVMWSSHD